MVRAAAMIHGVEMSLIEINGQFTESNSIHGHGFKDALRQLVESVQQLEEFCNLEVNNG